MSNDKLADLENRIVERLSWLREGSPIDMQGFTADIEAMLLQAHAAEAAQAQDARDAARYRWLRDKSGRAGQPYIRCDDPPFKPMDYWITAGTADNCIDRAMAKESGR